MKRNGEPEMVGVVSFEFYICASLLSRNNATGFFNVW